LWILQMLAGTLCMSLAVNLFLVPLQLADGGVVGVGVILYYKFGIPTWVTTLVLNIPIIALGVKVKGWSLLWRTILGVGAFSGCLALTQGLPPVTHEIVLGIIYGGLLMGLGLGLVLRSGATTGGTDILAIVGQQKLGISVGTMVLLIDGMVLTAAGIVFSPETALWSAITLMISSKMVDVVNEGLFAAKGITIITANPPRVAERIMNEVGRGCTILKGIGAYTGQPRDVLYVVVQRGELALIKQIVAQEDPRAFMVVSDAHEVLGEGFRPHMPTTASPP